jgi:hypothetical protein
MVKIYGVTSKHEYDEIPIDLTSSDSSLVREHAISSAWCFAAKLQDSIFSSIHEPEKDCDVS